MRAVAMLLLLAHAGCRHHFDALADARVDASGDGALTCADLQRTCGPSGDQSCCGAQPVPGGMFFRSYDMAIDGLFPNMTNPAMVSSFSLDTYEVTVGRFRQFVEAGFGTQASPPIAGTGGHPNLAGSEWSATWNSQLPADTATLIADLACNTFQTWTAAPGANETKPINCAPWYVAFAFCIWDGGYLPTEAEWNFAAAGGTEQRAYPWSMPADVTTLDCSYADYQACPAGISNAGALSPQGDGRFGHADLGGNVWEWILDYQAAAYQTPCTDCANLTASGSRIVRGGSFVSTPANLRASDRFQYAPTAHNDNVGIRCARP